MATRSFCDLCGEPAMPNAYQYLTLGMQAGKRFYIDVNFSQMHYDQPRTTDVPADICKQCLMDGLESMKVELQLTCTEQGLNSQ